MDRRIVIATGTAVGLVGLGVAGLAVLPWLLADDVRALVDAELDRALDADVELGAVEVGLWSTFPNLNASVSRLEITPRAPFDDAPLLSLPEARVELGLMSLLGSGPIDLRGVSLTAPVVRLRTLADGSSNLDAFTGGDDGGEGASWEVRLSELTITDGALVLDDDEAELHVTADGLALTASGDLSDTVNALTAEASVDAVTLEQGGTTWLKDTAWTATADLEHALATSAITLKDSTIGVNALSTKLTGTVAPTDAGWDLDLELATPDTAFKPLLSLVPGAYTDAFDGVDADGTLTLAGTVAGTYSDAGYPGLDLALAVRQGRFRYPDLPVGVDDIGLDIAIRHPGGDLDLAQIDIDRMAMNVGGTPIEGRMRIRHPVSDPDVELAAEGRLDLDQLARALPQVADAEPPSGVLDVDVTASGRMSAFQAQRTDDVRAEGTIKALGLRYQPEDWPVVRIDVLDLELSPARAELRALELSWPRSDLSVSGAVDNVLPWWLAGEPLTGALEVRSTEGVDLRPFQGDDDGDDVPDDADDAVVVAVPADLDLTADVKLPRVRTTELDATDVAGTAVIRDHTITLDRWKASMLGGRATLSGSYRAETEDHADVDMSVDGVRFDVQRTATRFETLTKVLPILTDAVGRFDTDADVSIRILRDGTPELSMLASTGLVGATGITVSPPTIRDLAARLGQEQSTLDPSEIRYRVAEGSLKLDPFDARIGRLPATVSGTVGVIDRALDLAMDLEVPTRGLSDAPFLKGLAGAVPATATVRATVTGTVNKPKLGLRIVGADDVVDAVKEAVEQEVRDRVEPVVDEAKSTLLAEARAQGDALVAAAEREAERLRAEAKKAADKLRRQAGKEADRLVDEAKGNPLKLAAAKEAAKVVEKEADKAANKVEREADKAADTVVSEAKGQRDTLIREAEAKLR